MAIFFSIQFHPPYTFGPSAKAPPDLISHIHLDTQLFGERPHQSWVLLEHPADDGQIQALFQQLLGLFTARDGSDGADGHLVAYPFFDGFGEWRLVAWTQGSGVSSGPFKKTIGRVNEKRNKFEM